MKEKSCFVIGPIGDKLSEPGSGGRELWEQALEVFEEVIFPACSAFGLRPLRADQISQPGEIPEQIFKHLRNDDVVIADLTGANPNVMYELGLRHTVPKLTIQIGEYGRLPFDVATIRTILFKRTAAGLIEARKQLKAALSAGLELGGLAVGPTRVWLEETPLTVSSPVPTEEPQDESGFLKEPGQTLRPDLELLVLERPGAGKEKFELVLSARDPELDLVRRSFGFITFQSDLARFFELHLRELKRNGPAAIGAYLTEKLLPRKLTLLLASLRGKARTLQIRSDDPWIPWELLRIEENAESDGIEGPFLCEAFALTRWFHPVRKTTTWLPLSRVALIAPEDSGLPQTAAECQDMLALGREGERRVDQIPARVGDIERAMQSGEYDGWHFSGHGSFRRSSPDLSILYLDQEKEFTPVHLSGKAKRMGVRRPLVFLNGSSTAGWAQAFLQAGAGAFIGALWPTTDSLARRFARVFYERFLAGQTISEAVFEARQAIRSETDPTWLAYTVFAHPLARQRRGED